MSGNNNLIVGGAKPLDGDHEPVITRWNTKKVEGAIGSNLDGCNQFGLILRKNSHTSCAYREVLNVLDEALNFRNTERMGIDHVLVFIVHPRARICILPGWRCVSTSAKYNRCSQNAEMHPAVHSTLL